MKTYHDPRRARLVEQADPACPAPLLIQAAGQAAVTPAQRLAIALAAVHAARLKAIRELTLDDIDLPTGASPSPVTGSARRLTCNVLLAWLGYRRATWPDTASRHVLVSRISALGTGTGLPRPPGKRQPRGVCLDRIRRDRIRQEALATGADPSTLPWSSTSTTPTRWPTPTPPETVSAPPPNRHLPRRSK